MKYRMREAHYSNYPDPITVSKGTELIVGEEYKGPENWENWRFCHTIDNTSKGWVPEQLLAVEGMRGTITEDYTAKELNAEQGEIVEGKRELNGWVWCVRIVDGDEGWLPKEKLDHF